MNSRAILFTKDRPLQLRGLLESFQHHAKPVPPITIVGSYRADYSDLISDSQFDCNWLWENDLGGFTKALTMALDCSEDYILLGVDDQTITGCMSLTEAERMMANPQMLCYSFRLGKNIANRPMRVMANGLSIYHAWRGQTKDWGYPFSLDCHLYRRKDLEKVLDDGFDAKVPADFEVLGLGLVPEEQHIYMAWPNGSSVAYCSDLNKVQLKHGAPAFGRMGEHDVQTLLEKYSQGWRFDWEAAEGFVGTDAFVKDAIWKLRKQRS